MDRESLDFRGSAVTAAPSADQAGPSDSRPLPMRERLYSRDRHAGQVMTTAPRDPASQQNRNIQTVTIQSILKGAREAIIDFDGAAYRLRITRNHRLILTK
jgi:hemin uptake protein HemP